MLLYLIIHCKYDHQFPKDGDEIKEEVHTVPKKQINTKNTPIINNLFSLYLDIRTFRPTDKRVR